MKLTKIVFPIATSLGLLAATPAAAEPIEFDNSDINVDYTIDFNAFTGDGVINDLTSQLILTLTSIVGGTYNFDYSIINTTDPADTVDGRVSGFAFNTDPTLASASVNGTYTKVGYDANYPNGIGNVDVCFKDSGSANSCAGGGSAGPFAGQSGGGTLSLNFGGAVSTLTLSDFYVRYQSVTGAGIGSDGKPIGSASGEQVTSSGNTTSGGTDVPEPSMVLLFGLAAGMIFAGTRRRRTEESEDALAIA